MDADLNGMLDVEEFREAMRQARAGGFGVDVIWHVLLPKQSTAGNGSVLLSCCKPLLPMQDDERGSIDMLLDREMPGEQLGYADMSCTRHNCPVLSCTAPMTKKRPGLCRRTRSCRARW